MVGEFRIRFKGSSALSVQAHPSEDLQAIETLWDAAFLPKKSGVGFPKTSSGKRSGCRIANLASRLPIKPAPKVRKNRFKCIKWPSNHFANAFNGEANSLAEAFSIKFGRRPSENLTYPDTITRMSCGA
jgi:hypothetical protein